MHRKAQIAVHQSTSLAAASVRVPAHEELSVSTSFGSVAATHCHQYSQADSSKQVSLTESFGFAEPPGGLTPARTQSKELGSPKYVQIATSRPTIAPYRQSVQQTIPGSGIGLKELLQEQITLLRAASFISDTNVQTLLGTWAKQQTYCRQPDNASI